MLKSAFAAALSGAALLASANAALISADTAVASDEFNSFYDPGNTIDGSGMPAMFDETSIHATYVENNHWTTTSSGGAGEFGPIDEFITWGFDNGADIAGIYIWNHLSNGVAANSGYEPVRYNIQGFTGADLRFDITDTLLTQEELDVFGSSQLVDFGDLFGGITEVTFTVLSNQSGSGFTGLAEVIFTDEIPMGAIPVPAAGILFLGALGGLGLRRRK